MEIQKFLESINIDVDSTISGTSFTITEILQKYKEVTRSVHVGDVITDGMFDAKVLEEPKNKAHITYLHNDTNDTIDISNWRVKTALITVEDIRKIRAPFKYNNKEMVTIDWFEVTSSDFWCNIRSGLRHPEGHIKSPFFYECTKVGENAIPECIKQFSEWWKEKQKKIDETLL